MVLVFVGKEKHHFRRRQRHLLCQRLDCHSLDRVHLAVVLRNPGDPSYTDCFICSAEEPDFQASPERGMQPASGKGGSQAAAKGSGNYSHQVVYMVTETNDIPNDDEVFERALTEECEDAIPVSSEALAMIAQEFPGHAMLDSGATESIASFEA